MLTKTFKMEGLDGEGSGRAVIANMNIVDHDGDLTLPGAFGKQDVVVIPSHDWGHVPLGKGMLFEEGGQAVADFKLNLNVDAARDWHAAMKFDLETGDRSLQEWSYGFEILESEQGDHDGERVRFLKSLRVFEISPVLRGAGIGTGTVALKGKGSLSFDEELLAVRVAVKRFVERCESLADLRRKDNRDLSQEKKSAIIELTSVLDSCAIDLKELTKEPIRTADVDAARVLRYRFERRFGA